MKRVAKGGLLLLILFVVVQCGGPKTLSEQKYQQLTPQERVTYLNKQIEDDPDDIELKKKLYQEYLNLNMKPQAVRVMKEVLELDPNQRAVQFEYAKIQYERRNYQTAYKVFRSILQSADGEIHKSDIANYIVGSYVLQPITSDSVDEGFPSFSHDGNKIVYQKRVDGNWDIFEYDLSTETETSIYSTAADEELPVYSPDGEFILFVSNKDDRRPVESKIKVREIKQLNLKKGYVKNLTQSVADDWLPRFSHDGSRIVFCSDRQDLRRVSYLSKQSDLFIMEKDGDFQQPLTETQVNEGGGSFSADDNRIFFHSNKNGNYDIFSMKTDGSQVLTIVSNPEANDVNPAASPDSQYVAFVSDLEGNYEIYRCTTTGSNQERLTFSPGVDSNPVYSPDGNTIAFHSDRNGNYDIYFINLEISASSLTTNDLIARLNQLINE